MKTLQQLFIETRQLFQVSGLEEAETEARLLLQAVLGLSRESLFLQSPRLANESEILSVAELAQRRVTGEPLSRIFGRRWFWKHNFKVSAETLDPRADSEVLIEAVLSHVSSAPLRFMDLGTGTGCLLLSLLQEYPAAQGVGVDMSAEAVATARLNAQEAGVGARAHFIQADWNELELIDKYDVIVSNPPYIESAEIARLQPEVRLFDPLRALDGGADGLAAYRVLATRIKAWIAPEGFVFFEIGYNQKESVSEILEAQGWLVLKVLPDIAGNDRCVVARLAHKA